MSPAHYGKFVAYFRVSTDRQGKSGLGLEAQRKSVLDFLDGGRWSLAAEFTEVESGMGRADPIISWRRRSMCSTSEPGARGLGSGSGWSSTTSSS
jgi:hypothetical protein